MGAMWGKAEQVDTIFPSHMYHVKIVGVGGGVGGVSI